MPKVVTTSSVQAEIELLRRRIAERRPGGRQPTAPAKVERIEQEIAAGGTDRAIAKRYKVSHMTVFRVRKRMAMRREVIARHAS